jgi:hypothetical protein
MSPAFWQGAGMARRRTALTIVLTSCLVAAAALIAAPAAAATTWSVVPTPNRGDIANSLNSVTALSVSSAWAVGSAYDVSLAAPRTLVERWNGTRWSTVASPNATQFYNELYGVSASSATDAWAVGYANTRPEVNGWPSKTVALHWNGTAWSLATTPNPASQTNLLHAVKVFSPTNAWAVGYYYTSQADSGALVLHWNGTTWTEVDVPEEATALYGISGTSASDIWAVGTGRTHQLATLHYNGATWSETPIADTGTVFAALYAVTAISPSDVWAVGFKNNYAIPLAHHWNGITWTEVPTPPVGVGGNNPFKGVTGLSATEVWAVGYTTTSNGPQELIERWNGSAWQVEPAPAIASPVVGLDAAAAVRPSGGNATVWSTGSAWGFVTDHWAEQTLAIRGTGN